MSKIKFGNFITYTGKYLSTAMSKAQSGNLVFARIIDSPTKDSDAKAKVILENVIVDGQLETSYEVNNINKDGYYIFGGKADGHLVTFDVFEDLKAEVAALDTKVGDLKIGSTTYATVPAYVDAKLANIGGAAAKGVTQTVRDASSATHDVLPTEKAVRDVIDAIPTYGVSGSTNISVTPSFENGKQNFTVDITDKVATKAYVEDIIGSLGEVMTFIGVAAEIPTSTIVTLVSGTTATANNGDVVTVQNGEEYIYNGQEWIEIGKVGIDEAVTSAQGSSYVTVTSGTTGAQKRGDITISVVTSGITSGSSGLATAADVYTAIEAAKNTAIGAASVIGATGYLKVENKNVLIDDTKVQLGTTNTDTKLTTKGYVDEQLESIGNSISDVALEAAKHSSVSSVSEDYIGVTGVTASTGSINYQVSLKVNALQAANHPITEIQKGGTVLTTSDTVQEALQELFEGNYVASESLIDLNDRLEVIEEDYVKSVKLGETADSSYISITPTKGDVKIDLNVSTTNAAILQDQADDSLVSAAGLREYSKAENITVTGITGQTNVQDTLEDLYSKVTTVDGEAIKSVTGDTYVGATTVNGAVTLTTDIADAVDTSAVTGYVGTPATGLATDAYVKDYVAMSLSWEEIIDDMPVIPGGTGDKV